jgi:hypothetical protein
MVLASECSKLIFLLLETMIPSSCLLIQDEYVYNFYQKGAFSSKKCDAMNMGETTQ